MCKMNTSGGLIHFLTACPLASDKSLLKIRLRNIAFLHPLFKL